MFYASGGRFCAAPERRPMPQPHATRRTLLALGVLATLAAGGFVADNLFRGGLQAPFDFTEYWAAGRLNARGENPYDGSNVRAVQRGIGLDDTAIMMWNPPWTLALVMPVGLLDFRTAYGVWVLANVALLLASAELLWRGFGGDPARRWLAYLLALTFVPTIFLIGSGQITGVVLVGLAGFLVLAGANRPLLAGAVGALTAVKPHLLALFALWLLLDAIRSRAGRRVVLGGLLVGLAACVSPTVANPDVWAQYLTATTGPSSADHHNLARWTPPLLGWWLRTAVPGQPFWVQWVPLALAAVGFAAWYRGADHNRPAADRLPWVVGLSLLFAPYGVWQHDLVLLLVPILATATEVKGRRAVVVALGWLAAVNALALAMMVKRISSEWYVWVTPVVLLGCAVVSRLSAAREPARTTHAPTLHARRPEAVR